MILHSIQTTMKTMFFEMSKIKSFSQHFLKNDALENQIIKLLIKFSCFFHKIGVNIFLPTRTSQPRSPGTGFRGEPPAVPIYSNLDICVDNKRKNNEKDDNVTING